MKLKVTRLEAFVQDRYSVRMELDWEWGWHAYLTLDAFGNKTQEAALRGLVNAAKEFIEAVELGEDAAP